MAQIHVEGKDHKKNVRNIGQSDFSLVPQEHRSHFRVDDEGWFVCTLCDKKCNGAEMAQIHVAGKNHKRNVRNEAWQRAQPPRWSTSSHAACQNQEDGAKGLSSDNCGTVDSILGRKVFPKRF